MKVIYTGWQSLKLAPDLAIQDDRTKRYYGWLFVEHLGQWVTLADLRPLIAEIAKQDPAPQQTKAITEAGPQPAAVVGHEGIDSSCGPEADRQTELEYNLARLLKIYRTGVTVAELDEQSRKVLYANLWELYAGQPPDPTPADDFADNAKEEK